MRSAKGSTGSLMPTAPACSPPWSSPPPRRSICACRSYIKTRPRFPSAASTARHTAVRCAPFITYGWSKAHRPDLKQLLWVLTTTADGAVPVQFRCEDGNTSDSRTHAATWDTLLKATGRSDFLYVADSKLCSEAAMDHIDRRGGRLDR